MKFKTIKGSTKLFEDNSYTFTPYGEGEPQSEEIKKVGDARLSRSTGQKTQSVIAHLKVKADCPDVTAALFEQLQNLTKGQWESLKVAVPQGRILEKNDDFRLVYNQTQGRLNCLLTIDLGQDVDYMKKFNNINYKISQCLYFNEDFLKKQCRALASASTK
ncbi:MAG: hypothetical protein II822_04545 [Prevotella sp.]|nr:hypothetical protein [Prevotella sp.]